MRIKATRDPLEARRTEYPQLGDQMDAMLALAEALEKQGIQLPQKTKDWISTCNRIKKKYPVKTPRLKELP
jgi:hypothetical protein